MTVNSTNVVQGSGQGGWRSTVKQAGQDFEQLFQAMQAGNLAGAQQAYSALQQLQGNTGTASDASQTTAAASTASATSSPLASAVGDWSALGQALQSGDMSSAQTDFSKLQSDLTAAAKEHHHHHGGIAKAQAVYSAMQSSNGANAATQGTGNAVSSDIDGLKKALQSGNVSSAQDLLARLEQDLKASGQSWNQQRHHGVAAAQSASYADSSTTAVAAPTAA